MSFQAGQTLLRRFPTASEQEIEAALASAGGNPRRAAGILQQQRLDRLCADLERVKSEVAQVQLSDQELRPGFEAILAMQAGGAGIGLRGLRAVVAESGRFYSDDELIEVLERGDRDGDGMISLGELAELLAGAELPPEGWGPEQILVAAIAAVPSDVSVLRMMGSANGRTGYRPAAGLVWAGDTLSRGTD